MLHYNHIWIYKMINVCLSDNVTLISASWVFSIIIFDLNFIIF
nr:hypothetical protein CJLB15_00065 [Campylobacter phage CJLB-15]